MNAEIDALRAAVQAVRDLHVKVENPRHGCCAPPQLCEGHGPECRGGQHPLGGVPWPCKTIRALDEALSNPPGDTSPQSLLKVDREEGSDDES